METWTGAKPELDGRVARLVAERVRATLRERPHAVLGVVGGRSVGGIYGELAREDLPWERVHVFLADERLVPVTSDESNFRLVHVDLLDGLVREGRFPEANAHACTPDPADPRPGIDAYGRALDALGGRFDVAILSAGEDGHCASLFPCHASVADEGERFLLVENSPKPPPRRVSASRRLLERSGLGVVVVYGEGKRDALALLRDPKVGVHGCPSKLVASIATSYLVTDLA
ncbi:6-phosphogluconolactonase [bacterium]|nr:6-phosphogluconolactonase [bacterium]